MARDDWYKNHSSLLYTFNLAFNKLRYLANNS